MNSVRYYSHVLCDQLTYQWGLDLGVRLEVKLQILFQEVLHLKKKITHWHEISRNGLKMVLSCVFVVMQMFSNLVGSFFVRNNNKRLCQNTFSVFYIFFNEIQYLIFHFFSSLWYHDCCITLTFFLYFKKLSKLSLENKSSSQRTCIQFIACMNYSILMYL